MSAGPGRLRAIIFSRPIRRGGAVLALVGIVAVCVSLWLTPALEPLGSRDPARDDPPTIDAATTSASAKLWPEWPETRLDGPAAKALLLGWLEACEKSIHAVQGCTMTFRKQERIKGKLLPEQTYQLKVRHRPFAVYMKSVQPVSGRELIFATGQHDNQVIGHPAGMSRLLVPRFKMAPDHPLIMAESRHPVDQAGLANLIRKMVRFRQMDRDEPDAITILDRTETPDGKKWLRSTHLHPVYHASRPFAEAQVLYDPENGYPLRFTGYDWPAPGEIDRPLGERYCYDDLRLDIVLSDRDFDPANPEYLFHRF